MLMCASLIDREKKRVILSLLEMFGFGFWEVCYAALQWRGKGREELLAAWALE